MIPDVLINNISLHKMGWTRESIDFPTPQSQSETVVVPGRNSPIRFAEALGSISYQPRAFTIVLTMLGTRSDYDALVADTVNQFSGKLCKVICSEDTSLYVLGTLEASPSYDPKTGKGTLTFSCEDGDSYRYYVDETKIEVSGKKTTQIENDYMAVVPTITVTSETTLAWKVGDESFSKTLSIGIWEIPELELQYGMNEISITSSGKTTFVFREGRL